MPAAVESGARVRTTWGNMDVEMVNCTFASNGDTFTSEFGSILGVQFEPTTNSAAGFTISGKVATIVSGGSLTGWLVCFADNT